MPDIGMKVNMRMSKQMYSRTKNIYSRTICGVADAFTWTDPEQVKTITKLKRLDITKPEFPEPFTDISREITDRELVDGMWTCALVLYRDKQKEMVAAALDTIMKDDNSIQRLGVSDNENEVTLDQLKDSFVLEKIYTVTGKSVFHKRFNIHFKYRTRDTATFSGKDYKMDLLIYATANDTNVTYRIGSVDFSKE